MDFLTEKMAADILEILIIALNGGFVVWEIIYLFKIYRNDNQGVEIYLSGEPP